MINKKLSNALFPSVLLRTTAKRGYVNIQGHMRPFLDIPNPKSTTFLTPRHSSLSASLPLPGSKLSPKQSHQKLNRKGGCIKYN